MEPRVVMEPGVVQLDELCRIVRQMTGIDKLVITIGNIDEQLGPEEASRMDWEASSRVESRDGVYCVVTGTREPFDVQYQKTRLAVRVLFYPDICAPYLEAISGNYGQTHRTTAQG